MATSGQPERGTTRQVVVAIDLGTTYSGYAFSFSDNPLLIYMNHAWSAGSGSLILNKTSTCVLLTPDRRFYSFGFEAENKYAELAEDNQHWYFFRHFKMMLYNTTSITEKTMLFDISNKQLPAIDIFAHSIRYLKDHFKSTLRNRTGSMVDSDIQYVLTVPAIWSDKGKIFMRIAAIKAGIPGGQLQLSLESEAAWLFRQLNPKESHVDIGRNFIVVDFGGGKADITFVKQNEEGNLRELHAATGGPWGGTIVNNELENTLSNIFGRDALANLKIVDMHGYYRIMRSFETSKRNMQNRTITLKLPKTLVGNIEETSKTEIRETRERETNKRIDELGLTGKYVLQGKELSIDILGLRELFSYPIDCLIQHLESLLRQDDIDDVDSILLDGGFSDSSIVRERISEAFPDKKVISPPYSDLAVLKGAVRFGHFPRLIAVRKSKYFYGLRSWKAFDPNKHPERKKVFKYGKHFCTDIFSEIIARGEDLPYGREFTQNRRAVDAAQTSATEELYSSTSSNTAFVDEEGCFKIGVIKIEFPHSDNIDDKRFTTYVSFWDTEIKYRVEVKGSETVYEERFDQLYIV